MSEVIPQTITTDTSEVPEHHLKLSLVSLLILAVILALIIVTISYIMYLRSPDRKFDLARPGNPNNNAVVGIEDSATDSDTSSVVDAQTAKQKLDSLDKETRALSGFGVYNKDDISDQSLGLQSTDQPAL